MHMYIGDAEYRGGLGLKRGGVEAVDPLQGALLGLVQVHKFVIVDVFMPVYLVSASVASSLSSAFLLESLEWYFK